jgi:hypothetical protein
VARRIYEPAYCAVMNDLGDEMSNYMLLLYAPEMSAAEQAERAADMPKWIELTNEWREAGSLVATGRLHPIVTATTVRTRDGETELTDGPFAVTKEILGGYYILECADLDEALRQAERLPIARYGSVEVRPIMDDPTEPAMTPLEGTSSAAA